MVKILVLILSRFINQEQLITRLAESYPIRRAAQLLVYMYNRNKENALQLKDLTGLRLTEGLKKLYKELEDKKKKG